MLKSYLAIIGQGAAAYRDALAELCGGVLILPPCPGRTDVRSVPPAGMSFFHFFSLFVSSFFRKSLRHKPCKVLLRQQPPGLLFFRSGPLLPPKKKEANLCP